MPEFFIVVWVRHESLFLPDEWLHLSLFPLNDLSHGLIEEITSGIHAGLSILLALGSVSSSAARNGSRLTDHSTLHVGNPSIWTLIALSREVGLHLHLDGPTSGDSSCMVLRVFDHRILNYKIIVKLLVGHRVGLGQLDRGVREPGEPLIVLHVTLRGVCGGCEIR